MRLQKIIARKQIIWISEILWKIQTSLNTGEKIWTGIWNFVRQIGGEGIQQEEGDRNRRALAQEWERARSRDAQ